MPRTLLLLLLAALGAWGLVEEGTSGGPYGGDYTVNHVAGDDMMHPSEFFTGALQRPLLQIIKPENGQVRVSAYPLEVWCSV